MKPETKTVLIMFNKKLIHSNTRKQGVNHMLNLVYSKCRVFKSGLYYVAARTLASLSPFCFNFMRFSGEMAKIIGRQPSLGLHLWTVTTYIDMTLHRAQRTAWDMNCESFSLLVPTLQLEDQQMMSCTFTTPIRGKLKVLMLQIQDFPDERGEATYFI